MKVAILAGGFGTRLAEETTIKPKPMIDIGGKPILWHIMKIYAKFGYKEFVIALGYKGEMIKDYFINYRHHANSLMVSLSNGSVRILNDGEEEDWTIHLLDTGINTQTGGRIKKIAQYIGNENFMLTYGDGVGDIDIAKLYELHHRQGKLATVTAVRPPARFGGITFSGEDIVNFAEKPQIAEGWINGGFFILEPGVTGYIENDDTIWEREPMERLVVDKQLVAYRHEGFWQCIDTIRDVRLLETYWHDDNAPWKIW